jgi:hypothetical protein
MKRKSFIGAVAVVAFFVAFAGISQAGGWMHKPSEDRKSMEQASDISAPEFWTDEYGEGGAPAEFWGPVETGTLPGSDESSRLLDTGVDPSRWEEPNGG